MTGSGFGAAFGQITPSALILWQCVAEGVPCTRATGSLQPDAQGALRGRAVLSRILIGRGRLVDCAERPGRCVFGTVPGQTAAPAIALSFIGGDAPPRPTIRVDPGGVIRDGAQVTVSASDLPPFGGLSIAKCVNGWSVLDMIPLDGIPCVLVGEVWKESLSGSPSRTAISAALIAVIFAGSNYGTPEIDCSDTPGRCALLLVFNETVVDRVELTFAA